MSEIWLRTHACTDDTKSINPRFGLSPMGPNKPKPRRDRKMCNHMIRAVERIKRLSKWRKAQEWVWKNRGNTPGCSSGRIMILRRKWMWETESAKCTNDPMLEQIPIFGGNPHPTHKSHSTPIFFMVWINFGTLCVMKVVVKFHQNCRGSFWKESKYLFGGVTPVDPL